MRERFALLVIDVQNDFCEGGSLAVAGARHVIPVLNRYISLFSAAHFPIFVTRDWHPVRTRHFQADGGPWPPHCVRDSHGAEFHPDLKLPEDAQIISKGMEYDAESYSAFTGIDQRGRTLTTALRQTGVEHLAVGGLATDYCVKASVLNGLEQGFQVTVLQDAVRGVDEETSREALIQMTDAGATKATYAELANWLNLDS